MNRETTPLKIVIVGHVDHGKSTLIGRLLYTTQSLPAERIDSVRKTCRDQNRPFELAFLLDALEEEQTQNVTIDTTRTLLKTPQRPIWVIDAPGHREFLKNMVSGAASADAAVLIIDAAEGIREQTRCHLNLLAHLGLHQVLVLINKMDKIDYDQNIFENIVKDLKPYLETLNINILEILPISAREDDQIDNPSENMKWFTGPTVMDALDKIPAHAVIEDLPLRLPIQDVFNQKDERIYVGQLTSGQLNTGDLVRLEPSNRQTRVQKVYRANKIVESVYPGEAVGVTFADEVFLERGGMVVPSQDENHSSLKITSSVFWFDQKPLKDFDRVTLKLGSSSTTAQVSKIQNRIDSSTLEILEAQSSEVKEGETAEVIWQLDSPLFADTHEENPETGRFVLTRDSHIVGGGIVKENRELDNKDVTPTSFVPSESRSRSFAKALSWRAVATLATATIAWFLTKDLNFAVLIGAIDTVTKLILYYFHERAWLHVAFGRRSYASIGKSS